MKQSNKYQNKWSKELTQMELEADKMKRIRKLMNELLINSGYHDKNLEEQIVKLEQAGASDDEQRILAKAYAFNNKKAMRLWKRLDKLISEG